MCRSWVDYAVACAQGVIGWFVPTRSAWAECHVTSTPEYPSAERKETNSPEREKWNISAEVFNVVYLKHLHRNPFVVIVDLVLKDSVPEALSCPLYPKPSLCQELINFGPSWQLSTAHPMDPLPFCRGPFRDEETLQRLQIQELSIKQT